MNLSTEFVVLFIAFVGVASLFVFTEHLYNKTRERELNDIINQREVKRIKRKFKSKQRRGFDAARSKIVVKH